MATATGGYGDRWLRRQVATATGGYVPLEFAKGAISFNPQPTARNFNKPPRMLRLGQNEGGDTLPFATLAGRPGEIIFGDQQITLLGDAW